MSTNGKTLKFWAAKLKGFTVFEKCIPGVGYHGTVATNMEYHGILKGWLQQTVAPLEK